MCLEESEQGDRQHSKGEEWGGGYIGGGGVGRASRAGEVQRDLGRQCSWGCCTEEGQDGTQVWPGPLFLGGRREPVRRRSQEMLQNLGCGVPGAWPGVLVELSRSS